MQKDTLELSSQISQRNWFAPEVKSCKHAHLQKDTLGLSRWISQLSSPAPEVNLASAAHLQKDTLKLSSRISQRNSPAPEVNLFFAKASLCKELIQGAPPSKAAEQQLNKQEGSTLLELPPKGTRPFGNPRVLFFIVEQTAANPAKANSNAPPAQKQKITTQIISLCEKIRPAIFNHQNESRKFCLFLKKVKYFLDKKNPCVNVII